MFNVIEELTDRIPIGTKIIKGKDGWWRAYSVYNVQDKKWNYSNTSHGLASCLDRLIKKIENDIKAGDGFKDTKKWL